MDFVSTLVRLFKGEAVPKGLYFKYADRSYAVQEVGPDFISYQNDYGVEKLYSKPTSYTYSVRDIRVVGGSRLVLGRQRIVIDIGSS